MSRQSLEALATRPLVDVGRVRLAVRAELPPSVQRSFRELIGGADAGYFCEADRPILESAAVAVTVERELADLLHEQGLLTADGEVNPLLTALREQQRLVASLLTKCRLTVQARVSAQKQAATMTADVDPVAMVDFRRLNRG